MAAFVCPRATCLRSIISTARSMTGPSPAYFSSTTTAAAAVRPWKHDLHQRNALHTFTPTPSIRPSIVCRNPPPRLLSTTTPTTFTAHQTRQVSTTPTSTTPTPPADLLTWDRFFDLRRKRRYLNLVASLTTAVAAVGVVGPVLAQNDIDSWAAQISGLDPVIVLGLVTFSVAGGGWIAGPSVGNQIFRLWAGRRGWNRLIREKEKSFYARIKHYRADPSSSSPQNPIPDYYGEKIASVKDYRRWLKDQRAFNLKKDRNML